MSTGAEARRDRYGRRKWSGARDRESTRRRGTRGGDLRPIRERLDAAEELLCGDVSELITRSGDVLDEDLVDALVDEVENDELAVDIVVHAAGSSLALGQLGGRPRGVADRTSTRAWSGHLVLAIGSCREWSLERPGA